MTSIQTQAQVTGIDSAQLMEHIRSELAAQDSPVVYGREELKWDTGIGTVLLLKSRNGIEIRIDSDSLSNIHMLRETLVARLEQYAPRTTRQLEWTGSPVSGPYPPNFRIATIVSSQRISRRFQRIELVAENLEDFARSGLHVRLVIPLDGRRPVWPRLNAKGRTVWPTGADTPHTPAYTIRDIDPEANRLWIDILLHGNGPTCQWVQRVSMGTQVGLTGPGGGCYPLADRVLLAGDETALPLLARTLENAPCHIRGDVLVEVGRTEDRHVLTYPSGIRLRWLVRQEGDPDLNTALEETELPIGDSRLVWFAAEKKQAARAKEYLRNSAVLERKAMRVAAYWDRDKIV